MKRTVLISGGGIAGATLSFLLSRQGWAVTVVERSAGIRSSGAPVDVRGPALGVARKMGVLDALQDLATSTRQLAFVDQAGRYIGRIPLAAMQGQGPGFEIARGDLANVLVAAARREVDYVLGEGVSSLSQDPTGVDVVFERGGSGRFDLVIGADGLHSTVRRLAFGPEVKFVRGLGLYVSTLPLGAPLPGVVFDPRDVLLCSAPGRSISIHPGQDKPMAAFFFRARNDDFDPRGAEAQKRRLRDVFGTMGWCAPQLLERVEDAEDLYFDAVSRVQTPCWRQGRIALVGDAAACLSLFGDGSSMAMTGAANLALALAEGASDCGAALDRYEAHHRKILAPTQKGAGLSMALLVPKGRLGLAMRDLAVRIGSRLQPVTQ